MEVVSPIVYTADEVKAGDYIYLDGTTSDGGLRKRYADGRTPVIADPKPEPVDGKKVVGIVFWVPKDTDPTGRTTPASLTDDKIMAKDFPACTHGLAVSLEDVKSTIGLARSLRVRARFPKRSEFQPCRQGGLCVHWCR
ncbi:hypothetical protein NXV81_14265 [Bacteroides ovatus]|nr:hypothetical protein [Bacteroides ovatus]